MNERLKELADKSGFGPAWYDPTIPTSDIDRRWIDQSRLKEFAELIVRECVDEIKTLRGKYDTHQDVEPEENDWYVDAFLQAEVRLKEHFGVE